ncbi:MAG: YceI family protein [Allomuricauda sp.]
MKYFSTVFSTFILMFSLQWSTAQQLEISDAEVSFVFVSKNVKGSIAGFESTSKIDWKNLENSIFQGSVMSKTLNTKNALRNWSLRSGKYFDVDDFPKITFKSNQVRVENEKVIVDGDLTIKEISKLITIVFTKNQNQLIGTTSLYSIDYGIKIKKKREDNLVKVKFIFTLK